MIAPASLGWCSPRGTRTSTSGSSSSLGEPPSDGASSAVAAGRKSSEQPTLSEYTAVATHYVRVGRHIYRKSFRRRLEQIIGIERGMLRRHDVGQRQSTQQRCRGA